jgi:protein-S-isoprenylcysteine O-methyltransferase Ste14
MSVWSDFLQYLFIAGLVVTSIVRAYYGQGQKRKAFGDARKENPLIYFFMGLWGIAQLLPFFYFFSSRLEFADYSLPIWLGFLGAVSFVAAVGLIWRSHADLGGNWSPTLQIHEEHGLVTAGVYRLIRHPMYAAHILWAIAQPLIVQNWIAGWGGLIAMLPVYWLRVGNEEQMMLDRFGNEYREYMNQTGRIIPRTRV